MRKALYVCAEPPHAIAQNVSAETSRSGPRAVAQIAQSAYDRLLDEGDIDYRVLKELVDEASGKGVLRAIRHKHGPVAFEAIIGPILQEIGRKAPIRSTRYTWQPGKDPLTA